ncbi:rna exonuclease [Coemansia javaensis]|uniref:Rna exonuclease n=1 Tax=Coemansia javaensis TaxID=2761396 RepID=A0A9W8LI94_9FUNG|nr:rna exonuclease [Coemansia javaensis]
MAGHNAPLVWVDCEMTGLDAQNDTIIEIACIVTDTELNILERGESIVIHQPAAVMDAMGDWCKEHHGASGLTQSVLASTVTMADAEAAVLALVKRHCSEPGRAVLAGNSVHVDRMFLSRLMPELVGFLHYRIVDVSSVKQLARYWNPRLLGSAPAKTESHRALDDIVESINELRYYREHFFVVPARLPLLQRASVHSTQGTAPLVWIDVETTGLVADKDVILEVAMVVTDGALEPLGPELSLVVGQPAAQLRKLNAWSRKWHQQSGLLAEVARSPLTVGEAERRLLAQITAVCPAPNRAVLAGSNVGFDRAFIARHMPVLAGHLHYRNVDVSTVNELAKRWAPDALRGLEKRHAHRALDDVRESLRELRFYRDALFRAPAPRG